MHGGRDSELIGLKRFARALVVTSALGLGLWAPAAQAQTYVGTPTPEVGNRDLGAPSAVLPAASKPATPAAVLPAASGVNPQSGPVFHAQSAGVFGLAFTGADIAEMTLIGAAALGTGTILVRRARRSS
jgi:hypothetical protein